MMSTRRLSSGALSDRILLEQGFASRSQSRCQEEALPIFKPEVAVE